MTTIEELLAALDAELGLSLERRDSLADDATLQGLRHRLRAADRLRAGGQQQEAARLLGEARSLALASLAPGRLSADIVSHVDAVRAATPDPVGFRAPAASSTSGKSAPDASGTPGTPATLDRAARRRIVVWLIAGGVVLAVLWPVLIWASLEYDLPALRMIASWSMAAVFAAVVLGVAHWVRDRRARRGR